MPQEHLQKKKSGLPDFTNIELADVIDVTAIQEMMDDYYALTGIGIGIIDLKGKVLVGTGWQDVCVKFHRAVPESCSFCHESDISLSRGVPPGTFKEYHCKNNMWDIVTPIMLGERHIGNIFLGQFLYDDEEPDYELFRAQARRFGYDEAVYMAALDRVPRWSRETVRKAMGFYAKLAQMISKANYSNVVLADTLARREQTENALRESENKFSKAFQATPSALVISSLADGRYKEVNEAFERVLGFRRDEVIGHTALELNVWKVPEDRAMVLRMLAEGKKVRDLEIDFRSKSGTILVFLYSAEIIEIGAEQYLVSLLNDITARKKAEEELRQSEDRYRRLYNDTPVMLHSIDHDGRLVSVSNYWLETLGYERSEVLGRVSTEFLTAASRSYATEAVLPEFFRIGSCTEVPYQLVKKDGEILDVLLSAIAERDSEGKVVRSLAVMVDVTERKRAAEEIERLNTDLATRAAELEDANRELEAFNYTVAHDLRKPLTVVNGYFLALREMCGDKLDEACKGYLREACDGTLRMNRLIDVLLNFSRLGHVEPRREQVDLTAMAHEVVMMLQLAEPERQVDFRNAEGIAASADANLLRVVLGNLLGNAWKYTGIRKEAVIEFGTTEIDGNPVYFIRDNGAGFDKADEAKLFVPFQRLPGANEYRGFGIGLASVERIIRRHGGKVWAEGEPGKGACFYFTLSVDWKN